MEGRGGEGKTKGREKGRGNGKGGEGGSWGNSALVVGGIDAPAYQ